MIPFLLHQKYFDLLQWFSRSIVWHLLGSSSPFVVWWSWDQWSDSDLCDFALTAERRGLRCWVTPGSPPCTPSKAFCSGWPALKFKKLKNLNLKNPISVCPATKPPWAVAEPGSAVAPLSRAGARSLLWQLSCFSSLSLTTLQIIKTWKTHFSCSKYRYFTNA